MALVSNCAELQSFGVKDTDGMGDKQQKPVPRAAAAYGRQLKLRDGANRADSPIDTKVDQSGSVDIFTIFKCLACPFQNLFFFFFCKSNCKSGASNHLFVKWKGQKFSHRKLQLSVSNADNVRFAKPDRASSVFRDIHKLCTLTEVEGGKDFLGNQG